MSNDAEVGDALRLARCGTCNRERYLMRAWDQIPRGITYFSGPAHGISRLIILISAPPPGRGGVRAPFICLFSRYIKNDKRHSHLNLIPRSLCTSSRAEIERASRTRDTHPDKEIGASSGR